MKYLRQFSFRSVLISLLQAYAAVLVLFLFLPLLASAQSATPDQAAARQWAGNWLVVGQRDEQLVWQLKPDGSGYAYGFTPEGKLSHGFAISWRINGDQVRVRTGGTVHCNSGMIYAQFTGWSPVTLDFNVIDGRHWRQHNGGILAFQRRLADWSTPAHGSDCPSLFKGKLHTLPDKQTASAER